MIQYNSEMDMNKIKVTEKRPQLIYLTNKFAI